MANSLDKENDDILDKIENLSIINSLSVAIVIINRNNQIVFVNDAAEDFFQRGANYLCDRFLLDIFPADNPLFLLIEQARLNSVSVKEYGVAFDTPKTGICTTDIDVSPLEDHPDLLLITFHEQSVALKFGHHFVPMKSARSVSGIAALLAHEVKNPLSGIRGAAQIISQNCAPDDQVLAQLIQDECDRIFSLVDRMGFFNEKMPIDRQGVNIHSILEHVRRIAESGFGRHIRFIEHYDPSLPLVYGDRDSLIQIFLNLVKNAVEAINHPNGEVIIGTSWQNGVKLALNSQKSRVYLPIVIKIQDNGAGIPDDLRQHLFDPFVTSKANGSGLGLSLVAKLISDHGGLIEVDSQARRTVFKVFLPPLTETA
jgi:two-component system nitrogen regulation sensor histidine kinase GlnL